MLFVLPKIKRLGIRSWKNVLSDADKQKVIGNTYDIWQLSVNIIKLNKKLSSVHDNCLMNYE